MSSGVTAVLAALAALPQTTATRAIKSMRRISGLISADAKPSRARAPCPRNERNGRCGDAEARLAAAQPTSLWNSWICTDESDDLS